MFRTPRGYGNLNDLQAQLTPNFGYAGRLRDLTEQLSPEVKIQRDRRAEPIMRTMEIKTPPPTDVYDAISGMDAMKKGGKVKKYKVKQSNKNIAIAKNVVKVYYDRPKRRAAKRKPRVPREPVEEKKVIVQPSQVRPQFVTNVMGGNPGQPIALNEFTKRLGVLEDQLNKPKVLNKIVEEEKKVEIPQFVDTIPDAELQAIEQQIEKESKDEVAAEAAPAPKKSKPIKAGFVSYDMIPEDKKFNIVSDNPKNVIMGTYYNAGSSGAADPISYYQMGYNLDKKGMIKSYKVYKSDGTAENYANYVNADLRPRFKDMSNEHYQEQQGIDV